ncbi:MAG: response regulator transcription factor [Anaerolineae bacterium]|jgi:DNA-binding NarL/FixJ family response regulator|nr:response regulator transcription factor [Anaerolineae bacterium]
MTLNILIADDHKLFRQGLISLMRTRGDFVKVVGEAATGLEAIQLAEQLRPDIILMDIYMPERNGIEATREIRIKNPEIAIVILTSSESDKHLKEAVSLGISGYLLKNLDGDELFDLIAGIERGEAAMTRTMAARLLKNAANVRAGAHEELTGRELDVLRAVSHGASNQEIAEELIISVNTVKTHLKNISSKLQLDNRTQVAAYALEKGLVDL